MNSDIVLLQDHMWRKEVIDLVQRALCAETQAHFLVSEVASRTAVVPSSPAPDCVGNLVGSCAVGCMHKMVLCTGAWSSPGRHKAYQVCSEGGLSWLHVTESYTQGFDFCEAEQLMGMWTSHVR